MSTQKSNTGFTFIDNTDSPFIRHWTFLMRPPYNMTKLEMDLYSIMHDRQLLSRHNVQQGQTYWIDKNGKTFFYLEAEQIRKYLKIGKDTWLELKQSLINRGLLTFEERTGLSTCYYLETVDTMGYPLK